MSKRIFLFILIHSRFVLIKFSLRPGGGGQQRTLVLLQRVMARLLPEAFEESFLLLLLLGWLDVSCCEKKEKSFSWLMSRLRSAQSSINQYEEDFRRIYFPNVTDETDHRLLFLRCVSWGDCGRRSGRRQVELSWKGVRSDPIRPGITSTSNDFSSLEHHKRRKQ